PGRLALQLGAEHHLGVVHGEMGEAAAEFEQLLARVAVTPVLLDGVLDGLLGQAVLELEGGDRQAVDEQRKIERVGGVVAAVAQLSGDGKTVQREELGGPAVAGRRRAVEQVYVMRTVLDPVPKHVDDAALADLALQPGKKLL